VTSTVEICQLCGEDIDFAQSPGGDPIVAGIVAKLYGGWRHLKTAFDIDHDAVPSAGASRRQVKRMTPKPEDADSWIECVACGHNVRTPHVCRAKVDLRQCAICGKSTAEAGGSATTPEGLLVTLCPTCSACRMDPPSEGAPPVGSRWIHRGEAGVVIERYRVDGRDRVILRYDTEPVCQPVDVAKLQQIPGQSRPVNQKGTAMTTTTAAPAAKTKREFRQTLKCGHVKPWASTVTPKGSAICVECPARPKVQIVKLEEQIDGTWTELPLGGAAAPDRTATRAAAADSAEPPTASTAKAPAKKATKSVAKKTPGAKARASKAAKPTLATGRTPEGLAVSIDAMTADLQEAAKKSAKKAPAKKATSPQVTPNFKSGTVAS